MGDEDNIERDLAPPKEDEGVPGEEAPKDEEGEEAKEADPLMEAYKMKLRQADLDEIDSEEEYQPLEIRTKVESYQREHGEVLSSELMSEAFRWRLSQTDCQNRGYVLDGYPKSYKTAQEVFVVTPVRPEPKKAVGDGDEDEEAPEEKVEEEDEEEAKKKYAP